MPATHLSHTASTHSLLLSQHPSLQVLEGKSREVAKEQKDGGEMEAAFHVELQPLQGVKPAQSQKISFLSATLDRNSEGETVTCLQTAVPVLLLKLHLRLTSVHPIHEEAASVALRWDGLG